MFLLRLLILPLLASACATSPLPDTAEGDQAERGPAAEHHHSPEVRRLLAEVRQATAQYHDIEAAFDDGYVLDPHCVSAEDLGAPPEHGDMGFHLVNFDLLDDQFDPLTPEILVYEERPDGKLHLVAVEYVTLSEEPPAFAGEVEFGPFPPMGGWALHAWVWLGNPNGVFADLNPNVVCPGQ